MRRMKAILSGLMLISVLCSGALAQTTSDRAEAARARNTSGEGPVVLGHGVGLFKVGPLLAHDDFENLDNWVVQIQERSGFAAGEGRGTRPFAGLPVAGTRMHGVVQEEAPDSRDDYLRRALPNA